MFGFFLLGAIVGTILGYFTGRNGSDELEKTLADYTEKWNVRLRELSSQLAKNVSQATANASEAATKERKKGKSKNIDLDLDNLDL